MNEEDSATFVICFLRTSLHDSRLRFFRLARFRFELHQSTFSDADHWLWLDVQSMAFDWL